MAAMLKTEHSHPHHSVKSTHFFAVEKGLKKRSIAVRLKKKYYLVSNTLRRKNGSFPPTLG